MKTKIFKIGMPLMVFMLAIVFAFATPTKEEKNNVQTLGYIQQVNDCVQVFHNCTTNATLTCTIGSNIVYSTKSGTVCENQMTRWP